MGDRGEDMEQMTPGWIRTRAAAFRTEPTRYELYSVSHQGGLHLLLSKATYNKYICQKRETTHHGRYSEDVRRTEGQFERALRCLRRLF